LSYGPYGTRTVASLHRKPELFDGTANRS